MVDAVKLPVQVRGGEERGGRGGEKGGVSMGHDYGQALVKEGFSS